MRYHMLTLLLAAILFPGLLQAQGVLIETAPDARRRLPRVIPGPRTPSQSYRISELKVDVTMRGQIAQAQVSQTFVNTGSRAMEVCFVFPLPYDGAVERMTFMVDGKEHEARLLTADEARRIYEGYVRRNRDPALMEWVGTGMFKTSVFPVPAGARRTVTLRYSQIARRHGGLTELLFPLSAAKYTARPVEKVAIRVTINSPAAIKNIYSPTHAITVERPDDKVARVSVTETNTVPHSDFRLMYDVGQQPVVASVLSYRPEPNEDGYFLMLVSPEIKRAADQVLPKNVVFVVDRSGSMSGKKVEQAKDALRFVLNNLNERDRFNIIAYDSAVESFRAELQSFTEETRRQALGFVEGIYAGGSTNIDGALQAALAQLKDDDRPNYVLFLTDGLPTAGERNEAKIVENVTERNAVRARIFSFGVGFDVNSRLLDKLAREGFGLSQYVRPNEDLEEHVSRLFRRIGAPVMTDLEWTFDLEGIAPQDGTAVNRVYPRKGLDLFAGDQLVMVGRYRHGGTARVTLRGKVGQQAHQHHFPAELVRESNDETHSFVEKLWAMRRIGEILDEIDLRGKNQELVDELVALSSRHGILTPYTSFLADENAPSDLAAALRTTRRRVELLEVQAGRAGFVQRELKLGLQQAPRAAVGGDVRLRMIEEDEDVTVTTVKQVGRKTFYLRDGRWVDSALPADRATQPVRVVKRFSPEYFRLATQVGKDKAKYLTLNGKVSMVLDGVHVAIED